VAALEAVAKIADVEKLLIAVGAEIGGNLLVIDALRRSRRMTHLCSIKVTHLKNRISV
jgi:hypothetical protein